MINGMGALATATTLALVLVAKFAEGAWITLLIIPALLLLFTRVRRHYRQVARETACETPLDLTDLTKPINDVQLDCAQALRPSPCRSHRGGTTANDLSHALAR